MKMNKIRKTTAMAKTLRLSLCIWSCLLGHCLFGFANILLLVPRVPQLQCQCNYNEFLLLFNIWIYLKHNRIYSWGQGCVSGRGKYRLLSLDPATDIRTRHSLALCARTLTAWRALELCPGPGSTFTLLLIHPLPLLSLSYHLRLSSHSQLISFPNPRPPRSGSPPSMPSLLCVPGST